MSTKRENHPLYSFIISIIPKKKRIIADMAILITLMTIVGVCLVDSSPRFRCPEFSTNAMIARVIDTGNNPNTDVTSAMIANTNGIFETCCTCVEAAEGSDSRGWELGVYCSSCCTGSDGGI